METLIKPRKKTPRQQNLPVTETRKSPLDNEFLKEISLSILQLATILGISRQYLTRNLVKLSKNSSQLSKIIDFCKANPSERNLEIIAQIKNWAKKNNLELKTPKNLKERLLEVCQTEFKSIAENLTLDQMVDENTTKRFLEVQKYINVIKNIDDSSD